MLRSFYFKDKLKRSFFNEGEFYGLLYKSIFFDLRFFDFYRFYFYKFLIVRDRNYSVTRIKNRCLFSFKKSSVIRFFRVSRMEIRRLADLGHFSGVRKSKW